MTRRLALLALLAGLGACGDDGALATDAGAADRGGADDVAAPFAPTSRTVAEVVALAYSPPRGASTAEAALRRTDLELASAAGVRTLRVELRWAEVEPEPGVLDFTGYDRLIDEALAAGLEIVVVLGYGPAWAGPGPALPPDDPRDFARFAGAAAAHFAGRVQTWEVWSEENAAGDAFSTADGAARYGELLLVASAAVRAAAPAAVIALGGLRYHRQTGTDALGFLERLHAAHPDVGGSFDVVALRPFATWPPVAAPEDDVPPETPLPVMVGRVRALLEQLGDPKPIIVTGVGWPVYAGVDEARQGRYLVRSLLLLAAAGVDLVAWHTLRDGPAAAVFPPDDAFGLLRYDADPTDDVRAAPKVAWQALLNLLWLLGDERLVADVRADYGLDERTHALRFGRPGYWVTVMWRDLDDDAQGVIARVPVRTTLRDTVLVTLIGAQLPIVSVNGSWEIGVGAEPVYLIEEVE